MVSAAFPEVQEGFARFLERDLNKELLRFTTAGSVDDGKSTLIGRLLHDSKAVYEDQVASVKKSRINRSGGLIDFSLFTDGLRAEREQGITIDVAYRYFSTAHRKFIIADTPGHEQYTRNMATGASTASLAIILIDATKGLLGQTRRHAYLASLLGIPNVLAAVNKMDLADYREEVFLRLQEEFLGLARQLNFPAVECIPISALAGENVVTRSEKMKWYRGPALLEHLETVEIPPNTRTEEVRLPVQYVIRPDARFRGFAGQLAGGRLRPGDTVLALPSGQEARVDSIVSYDGELEEAFAPMSVTVQLDREIDLSRGDMLVSRETPPSVSRHFAGMVVWFHAQPLELHRTYLLKHAGRYIKAKAVKIRYRVDVNTLAQLPASQLEMNGIAAVEWEASTALFLDPYARNRTTGSFILIDPISNATLGAAMIQEDFSARAQAGGREAASPPSSVKAVTREDREKRHGHRAGMVIVEKRAALSALAQTALFARGFEAIVVDGETVHPTALPLLVQALLSAGLLVIYSVDSMREADRTALALAARGRLVDFPAGELPGEDSEAVRHILAAAEALRAPQHFHDSNEADPNE